MYSEELVFIDVGPCDTLDCINRETGLLHRIPRSSDQWKVSGEKASSKEIEYLQIMWNQKQKIDNLREQLKLSEQYRVQTKGLFNFLQISEKHPEIKSAIIFSKIENEEEGKVKEVILAFSDFERVSEKELLRALKNSNNLFYMYQVQKKYEYVDKELQFVDGCIVYKRRISMIKRDTLCASLETCLPLCEVLLPRIRRSEMIEDLVKERDGGTVSPLGENELKEVLEIARQLSINSTPYKKGE